MRLYSFTTNRYASTPNPSLPPSRGKGSQDGVHHALRVIHGLLTAETQHAITLRRQPSVSLGVTQLAFRVFMPEAIHLDNETRLMTDEIGDVAPYRRLPAKGQIGLT